VNATPIAPPTLTATAGAGQIVLGWTAVPGATGYSIFDGTASGAEGAQAILTVTSGTSATVTGLTSGSRYYFTATATNTNGVSSPSSEVNATPTATGGGGGGGGNVDPMSIVALLLLATYRWRRLPVRTSTAD
jgi:chitodextrinase